MEKYYTFEAKKHLGDDKFTFHILNYFTANPKRNVKFIASSQKELEKAEKHIKSFFWIFWKFLYYKI